MERNKLLEKRNKLLDYFLQKSLFWMFDRVLDMFLRWCILSDAD